MELVVKRLEVLVKLIGIGLTNKKDYVIGRINEKANKKTQKILSIKWVFPIPMLSQDAVL